MKSTDPVNHILRINNLSVAASGDGLVKELVHDVSFTVGAGELFSIVGESGSGKTTLACALARLLPSPPMHVTGTVSFAGVDLLTLPDAGVRSLLRSEIRYVFQEPGQALNPIARIATQLKLIFDGDQASERRYRDLSATFGLPRPDEYEASYPHELSVGMLQRILLAAALAPGPRVLIADEATSAVDSLAAYQIMDTLQSLCSTEGLAVVFITHDLGLAKLYSSRIAVMSQGRMMGGID